jgi:hemoglobin
MTLKSLSLAGFALATMATGLYVPAAHAQSDEVYQQFGGKAGITAIITEAIENWQKDPRIARYFVHANIPHLRYELIQQVCNLTNGPCTYTGKDMKSAHEHMQLTQASFNALDEDLNTAMDDHHVPLGAQNYLTGKLAPMEQPIVTKNGF